MTNPATVLGEYADGWRPEPGDTIIGKVVTVDIGYSAQNGSSYPILTVQPDGDGKPVAVHAFHAGLKSRLMDLRPNVGEKIGIQYLGMREHKTDPTWQVAQYVARIAGRDAGNAWDRLESRTDSRPAPVHTDTADFSPTKQLTTDDDIPF